MQACADAEFKSLPLCSQATERSSVLSSFRSGLFGALYVISKQHVGSKASSFAELFIKLAQLLSFVLAEGQFLCFVVCCHLSGGNLLTDAPHSQKRAFNG